MENHSQQLRRMLAEPGLIRSLGAHDAFTGRIVESVGFETVFIGGFGATASLLGRPDLNFLTMTEMAGAVRRLADRVRVPVIADGDTGHGDLHHVQRTVRMFEQAGAAAILIEDQVAPKRCGHFAGKEVIPVEEMVLKVKAAVAARRETVIVARTDARAVTGLHDAIDRVNRYGEAGADVCFVEAPESREELERVARDVEYPQLVNMLTGGVTPILSVDELDALGFKIAVYPIASLLITARVIRRLAETLRDRGRIDVLQEEMIGFDEVKELLGLDEVLDLREALQGES